MNAFFILASLIALSAYFSLAEMALASSRQSRLAQMAEEGDSRAKKALKIKEDPSRLLAATQTGITAAALLVGIYGESAMSLFFEDFLSRYFPVLSSWVEEIAFTLTIILVTAVTIILAEIVPKRIAIAQPEKVAVFCAPFMLFFINMMAPAVFILSWISDKILAILPVDNAPSVTSIEDILAYVDEGKRCGTLAPEESHLVGNIFKFDDRSLASIMTPITDVAWLNLKAPKEENMRTLRETPHSRMPICNGDLQHIIGIVESQHILKGALDGEIDFAKIQIEQPFYIPSTLSLFDLLRTFRQKRATFALVVSEFGLNEGIVTMDDLVLSLVGDMMPTVDNPEDALAIERPDGSWLLDGLLAIDDLKVKLDIHYINQEELGNFHTVGGFVLASLGRIPRKTEQFEWSGWNFEVVDVDNNRVDQVLATKLERTTAQNSESTT